MGQLKPEGADFKLMKALLGFHPKGEEKGKGCVGMKVDKSPQNENRCFYMIKEDGSTEDFSAKKCLETIEANLLTPRRFSRRPPRKQRVRQRRQRSPLMMPSPRNHRRTWRKRSPPSPSPSMVRSPCRWQRARMRREVSSSCRC